MKICERMIEKIFNVLGLTEDDYLDDECENDRFILNHYGILIDKKKKNAYFKLNPFRYEIMKEFPDHVTDKVTDSEAFREIEYTRFELTSDNKILDKITNKEYDNLEEIALLLNSQNQFIDDTKDILDDKIQSANRNARYASEVGETEEMEMHLFYRNQFEKTRNEYKKIFHK
jgi:hypothetical protein